MNRKSNYCVAALIGLCISPACADVTRLVHGKVVDEGGQPLAGVSWIISECGLQIYDGIPYVTKTGTDGTFTLTYSDKQFRYDLQFSKPGFAPNFLYAVPSDSAELKVMMKRGRPLRGVVRRVGNGTSETLANALVWLRMPSQVHSYQDHCMTGPNGEFSFQVTASPHDPDYSSYPNARGPEWQVECMGHLVQVNVQDDLTIPDLDIEVMEQSTSGSMTNGVLDPL